MMNELIHIGNADISIKEYKGQRVVTFKDIDTVHSRPEGTARRNFSSNRKHFVEGEDFFIITPQTLENTELYEKRTLENDVKSNRGTALITEQGYLMLVKSFTDDLAWEVQRQLVNGYFRARNITNNLSPHMQMLYEMLDQMAKQELEIKKANEKSDKALETVSKMKDEVLAPLGDWRKDVNDRVRTIAFYCNIPYQNLFDEMYGQLEIKAHCNLETLKKNKISRLEKTGQTKTYIKNETTKLAVIEGNDRLKEIFSSIVREYSAKYLV